MRLGANRGLLDPEDKKEPVRLNSLLGDIAEGASEMIGDTLGGLWSFMSNPSEQKVADADARAEAIKQERLNDGMGNDWMYKTKPSDNPNKFFRFFENIPDATAQMYLGSSRMAQVPEETIKPVGNLIAGGVLNATGGLLDETVGVEQREMANQFAGVVKDSFKDWDSISNMIANNPLDFMGALVGAGYTAKSIADLASNPAIKQSVRNTLQSLPDPIDLLANNKMVSQFIPDPRAFATQWHGSKHPNVQKFEEKFMGTGQGADAYGWGFYNAQHHDVSVTYQGEDLKYEQDMLDAYDTANDLDDYFQKEMYENATLHMNPELSLKKMLEAYPKEKHAEIKRIHGTWSERYKDANFSDVKTYIPDSKIATMLNDDVAVWEQPQIVQDYLRKENGAYMDLVYEYKPLQEERMRLLNLIREKETNTEISSAMGEVGEDVAVMKDLNYKLSEVMAQQEVLLDDINSVSRGAVPNPSSGRGIYDWLVEKEIAEKGIPIDAVDYIRNMSAVKETISKRLDKAGILGRRFLDEESRYGDVDTGTFNTVSFNEDTAIPISNKGVPIYTGKGLELPDGGAINIGFAGSPKRAGDLSDMQGGLLDRFGHEIIAEPKIEIPEMSIFDLEGQPFVSSQADLTRAGGLLETVDGVPLAQPIEMLGGQDYMWLPRSVKENLVWASDAQPINKLAKEAQEIAKETGKEPIYIPFRMKPTGMDYSKQIANSMIQSALVRLNKSQISELNDTIRKQAFKKEKNKPKKYIGEDFKGIDVENPLNDTVSGDLRKEIIRIMDRDYRYDGGQKIKRGSSEGTASLAQMRVANADPSQIDKEPMTLQNVAKLDMDKLVRDVSFHDTYNTGIGGEALGRIKEDVSLLDLFDSKVRDKKGNITGDYLGSDGMPMTRANWTDDGYRKTTMQPVSGLLSHDRLMKLERDMKRQGLL